MITPTLVLCAASAVTTAMSAAASAELTRSILCRCANNKGRLKRHESHLVFNLRMQEFVALIKEDQIQAALDFARAHLAPLAEDNRADFKRAVALLVFRRHTQVPRYKTLLADERWKELSDMFMKDLLRVHNMPAESLFEAQLRVRAANSGEY